MINKKLQLIILICIPHTFFCADFRANRTKHQQRNVRLVWRQKEKTPAYSSAIETKQLIDDTTQLLEAFNQGLKAHKKELNSIKEDLQSLSLSFSSYKKSLAQKASSIALKNQSVTNYWSSDDELE